MVLVKLTPFLLAVNYFSVGAFTATVTRAVNSLTINGIFYKNVEYIKRDVVIVGGGSSGTYAAIGLIDAQKSVAVIDNQDRMGGHTNTYTDPVTGLTEDYGVIVYHNIDLVKKYAARLNVTLAAADTSSGNTIYADFRTGIENSTYSTANFTIGLALYVAQLQKYPYVETGFDLPNPVPEDLLLSFGDFAIKYNLGNDFVGFLANFAQGLGDLLSKPTLYVFKNFGMGVISSFTTGFLSTAAHDNSLIYQKAQAIIGDENVFLSAKIIAVNRSGHCAQILISTPSGYKFIDAKKLVFTIPPKIDNLAGWDLSVSEKTLFPKFNNSGYYVGVFGNTGLPSGASIINVANDTTYGLPPLPAGYAISPTTIPNVFNLYYGSPTSLTDDEVRAAMFAEFNRLHVKNMTNTTPKLLAYTRHTPFELWVPAKTIAAGFYRKLNALQGQKNTFYTGAAFHTHDSSLLWEFTQALLPNITASLS
ncbi:hypothetical protein EYC80_010133 [Monilinia laxa]|uniref:Amine oxidase domain-containing protein n=1 Tax=Monilinia laxa TaxID=61186 RepID=A0A5N6JLY3_MONLA|nr:hypothetical protein EYC80_010133 [Monilinia laxa]